MKVKITEVVRVSKAQLSALRACLPWVVRCIGHQRYIEYDEQLHAVVRALRVAGVRCPTGFGGWQKILRELERDRQESEGSFEL